MNRYLVVSDLMVGSAQLKEFVRDRTGGDGSTFHLVVPTIPDRRRLAWDESEAASEIQVIVDDALAHFKQSDFGQFTPLTANAK